MDFILNKNNKHLFDVDCFYTENETYKRIYINGEPTRYLCSSFGRIISEISIHKKPYELSQIKIPNGYYVVTLRHNGHSIRDYVHRLVGKAFIEIPEKYSGKSFSDLEINHINGNQKWNNSIYNIEWNSDSDNKKDAYRTGLSKRGEQNVHSKYKDYQIHDVCKYIEENILTPKEIKEKTGVSIAQILDIRNRGSWCHISELYNFSNYRPKQIKFTDTQLKKYEGVITS